MCAASESEEAGDATTRMSSPPARHGKCCKRAPRRRWRPAAVYGFLSPRNLSTSEPQREGRESLWVLRCAVARCDHEWNEGVVLYGKCPSFSANRPASPDGSGREICTAEACHHGVLLTTFPDAGGLLTALNWASHVRAIGRTPTIGLDGPPPSLLPAQWRETRSLAYALPGIGASYFLPSSGSSPFSVPSGAAQNGLERWTARWVGLAALLDAGIPQVVLSDTDVTWLRDPTACCPLARTRTRRRHRTDPPPTGGLSGRRPLFGDHSSDTTLASQALAASRPSKMGPSPRVGRSCQGRHRREQQQ